MIFNDGANLSRWNSADRNVNCGSCVQIFKWGSWKESLEGKDLLSDKLSTSPWLQLESVTALFTLVIVRTAIGVVYKILKKVSGI